MSSAPTRAASRSPVTAPMATVIWAVWCARKDPWRGRMRARKPRMLVAVELANRMARIGWALIGHRSPNSPQVWSRRVLTLH